MTTKVKSSGTSRKSTKVNAKELNNVVSSAAGVGVAPAGAGVGSGASAPAVSSVPAGSAGGGVRGGNGHNNATDQLTAALNMEDIKVAAFRQKIASHWAAPAFEESEEYKLTAAAIASLPADIKDRALRGAALAWAARPENAAFTPTISEIIDYINMYYAKEFVNVCGCRVPAAGAVRLYSYTNVSVSTITADSDINDYITSVAVPAGLGASSLVAVVMSVRFFADIKRRFAAARAAARNDFKVLMADAARMAKRLHISPALGGRYFSMLLSAVPALDDKEEKRLRKNLASCWAALRSCECSIVLAAPAGLWGVAAPIADAAGGFCFPAALPASAPAGSTGKMAKVRKLWAKRINLIDDIETINLLLSRAGRG